MQCLNFEYHRRLRTTLFSPALAILLAIVLTISLGACSSAEPPKNADQARVDYDLLFELPQQPLDYMARVQPILEQRCVVCHGCYDAPCQLKLTAAEGIARGASKERVYNGSRITAADPSRLFIDASTTGEWRGKGFYPVLNEVEGSHSDPVANLENSLMYQMLRLKQRHPQSRTGKLDDIEAFVERYRGMDSRVDYEKFMARYGRRRTHPRFWEISDWFNDHYLREQPVASGILDLNRYQNR